MKLMKKSSYVLILFVIFIWGGNNLLRKPVTLVDPIIKRTKKLENFSVVVAQPGSKVFLQTQWPAVKYPTFSYSTSEREPYPNSPIGSSFGVRNDTLFVFASSSEKEHAGDSFYCRGVKTIVGMEQSDIQLWYLKVDSLNLKLRYSKLSGDFDLSARKPRMLMLEADSSKIDFKNSPSFNQVNFQLNRSHLKLYVQRLDTCYIKGTLSNYSGLYVTGQPRMKVTKDATSYSNL